MHVMANRRLNRRAQEKILRLARLRRNPETGRRGKPARSQIRVVEVLLSLQEPTTTAQLAARAGCSQDTVLSAIGSLQARGFILCDGDAITFIEPEG